MPAPARRLLLGLLLVAAAAGWGAPGQAAPVTGRHAGASLPVSDCTPSAGVLVAVDFGHWGGPVVRGCSGHAASAIAAMHAAGFLTAGDEANGAAFVCRIGVAAEGVASERPTPAADPCVATPPATAYWSFWYADAGRSRWSYSPSGGATFAPAVGSVEAWAFGAGAPPGVTPAALRSRPPATTTTTTAPSTSTTTSTSTTGPPPTAATTTAPATPTTTAPTTARSSPATTGRSRSHPAASSTTTTTATGPAAGATRSSTTRPAASTTTRPTTAAAGKHGTNGTTPTTTRIVDAAAGGGSPGGGSPGGGPGSPVGLVAGAAVVVVLGGTGGVLAWRRRRAA